MGEAEPNFKMLPTHSVPISRQRTCVIAPRPSHVTPMPFLDSCELNSHLAPLRAACRSRLVALARAMPRAGRLLLRQQHKMALPHAASSPLSDLCRPLPSPAPAPSLPLFLLLLLLLPLLPHSIPANSSAPRCSRLRSAAILCGPSCSLLLLARRLPYHAACGEVAQEVHVCGQARAAVKWNKGS
jgi:hypothetical protein